jgi:hypothetical protein
MTRGPFTARHDSFRAGDELVASGFPFLHEPLVGETSFELANATSTLRFVGALGDALRAFVDGQRIGWAWGPDWELTFREPLPAGSHRLRVELVPNTFNTFGPHHYYNGDWHVVSPGQIIGEKNFADLPDAPQHTHVPDWHFRPLQLPHALLA